MNKELYERAQSQIIDLACAVKLQAEKEGWDKDPSWVSRGKDGRFGGGSGNKSVANKPSDSVSKSADAVKKSIGDAAESIKDRGSKAADAVKKSIGDADESIKKAVKSINTQFNEAAGSVKDALNSLTVSAKELNSDEKQRISDAISSPSGKKARKKIGSVLKKVSPEAAEVFDDATMEIEKSFEKKPVNDAISSALDIAGKSAQKVGEASLKAGKAIAPAALVLGGLAAAAATGGAAGILLAGGAVVALKNWSVPNMEGRGGHLSKEIFLHDKENQKDWLGSEKAYLDGAVSNLTYTAGLHTAMLATGILLAEVSLGTLDKDKKAFLDGIEELATSKDEDVS